MLKIGTLCWVIAANALPEYRGVVVEVVGPENAALWFADTMEKAPACYRIRCDKFPRLEWAARAELLPFSDPDNARPEFTHKPMERVT